jgi:ABC-type uncharacterized transport system involved in gliding motility auxiliary subunit
VNINNLFRRQLRFHSTSFLLLFLVILGLLAFMGKHYNIRSDWTTTNRNSLSQTSKNLLKTLDKSISFKVFASENEALRKPISDLIDQYRAEYKPIHVSFINPELEPGLARELSVRTNNEVIINYANSTEHLNQHNEQAYTNALQRLARSEERYLVFVSGHGERNPHGMANHDLQDWAKHLSSKGINSIAQSLIDRPKIPDNTAALVIASPAIDFLEAEINTIIDYLNGGGNLLWLTDPGSLFKLEPLARHLGLTFKNATVVNPNTQLFGISDPRITLISKYPFHGITKNFEVMTLFPQARPITINKQKQWHTSAILQSLPRSWAETGKLSGSLKYDIDSDIKGPVTIGVALTKTLSSDGQTTTNNDDSTNQQRIVVIGDGDFLSNQFLANAANLDFGLHIVNWLSHDDRFITIAAKTAPDLKLTLSSTQQAIIAFGFLIALPLIFAGSGAVIWMRRRKR